MYVKCFETKMTVSKMFKFATLVPAPLYVPTLAGTGTRMPASAGGDGWRRCRGRIAGAKDKVSVAGNP
ncbi:unnamed protein product [Staurois parvus]|uniref:Uncharacterized protein n=1 Tax=Staurois parvus TaxID=386267 RepID=A0ABN9GNZ0_9NEOB|nr:unnamed protein product [Staurois parvus]